MMADRLQYQFDFLQGKNEIVKAVAGIQTSITSVVKFAGVAFAGVFAGASIKAMIDAASEQEDAINELNTALAMTGEYSEAASKDLQDFASSMQSTTKYADDAVLGVSSLIQNLAQLDTQGLKQATKASLDLASALRIDVETAATMVGKAAQGNIATFQRYGIEIKKGTDDAETFANTLKVLEQRFGGAAAAAMNTFSGAMAGLKNAFGDVLERLGNIIVKNGAVIKVINLFREALINVEQFLGKNEEAIISFVQNGLALAIKAIGYIVKGFGEFQKIGYSVGSVILLLAKAFTELLAVLANFKIVKLIVTNVAGVITSAFNLIVITLGKVVEGWLRIIELVPLAGDRLRAAGFSADVVKQKFDKLSGSIGETANNLFMSKVDFAENLNTTADSIGAFEKTYNQWGENITSGLESAGNSILDLSKDIENARKGAGTAVVNMEKEVESTADKMKEVFKGLQTQLLTAWTQGKQGAEKLAGSIASAVGVALLGPMGQALGPIVELFAQGPEAVKTQMDAFIQAIPTIIENIVLSIPVVIESVLQNAIPMIAKLVERLVASIGDALEYLGKAIRHLFSSAFMKGVYEFVEGIVDGAVQFVDKIIKGAISFTEEIIKGAGKFIEELIKKIGGGAVGGIGKVGGFISNTVGSIGKVLGFADGGMIKSVPAGYPNDSFPARLQSGELVVDSDTTAQLKQFLNGGGNDVMIGLLNAILNELKNPMRVETSVQLNNQTMADIILNLNRNNARLA